MWKIQSGNSANLLAVSGLMKPNRMLEQGSLRVADRKKITTSMSNRGKGESIRNKQTETSRDSIKHMSGCNLPHVFRDIIRIRWWQAAWREKCVLSLKEVFTKETAREQSSTSKTARSPRLLRYLESVGFREFEVISKRINQTNDQGPPKNCEHCSAPLMLQINISGMGFPKSNSHFILESRVI